MKKQATMATALASAALVATLALTGCGGGTAANNSTDTRNLNVSDKPAPSNVAKNADMYANLISDVSAKQAGFAFVGVDEADAAIENFNLYIDGDKAFYDLKFTAGNTEYDLNIDAFTGAVEICQIESHDQLNTISADDAKEIALAAAGVDKKGVSNLVAELHTYNSTPHYYVTFSIGSTDYFFEVSAIDGSVVTSSAHEHGQHVGYNFAEAKQIAVENAGLSVDDVTFTKVEQSVHNGSYVYDIIFTYGGNEYVYKIDTMTGTIVRSNA